MLTRRDPLSEFARISADMNRLWTDTSQATSTPAVDISETEQAILVRAELPGVRGEDVSVEVENNVLTLSGQRQFERDEKTEKQHRTERWYGSFYRSFTLPRTVDAENIGADLKDGILTVTLPKRPEMRQRRISIKTT